MQPELTAQTNVDTSPKPEQVTESERRELELAQINGDFYIQFIELVLEELPADELNRRVDLLLDSMPPHFRRLYKKAKEKLIAELDFQRDWVEQNRETAVKQLLDMSMPFNPGADEQKQIVTEKTVATAELWEPLQGIPVIVIPAETYDEWKRLGGVFVNGAAVAFTGEEREEISFLLLRKGRMIEVTSANQLMHEFHHLIWHFLSRAGFLRSPDMGDDVKNKAFYHFRDEILAYIIQYREDVTLDFVGPEELVYSEDDVLLETAYQTKEKLQAIIRLAKVCGVPMESLLYPIAKAQNLDELIEGSLRLIEITPKTSEQMLNELYQVWASDTRMNFETFAKTRRDWLSGIIDRVIQSDNLQAQPDVVEKIFIESQLTKDHVSIPRAIRESESFAQFLLEKFGLEIDVKAILRKWVESKIPLTGESKTYIAGLVMEQREGITIPLDKQDIEALAEWLGSDLLWRADSPDFISVFDEILECCPELRELIVRNGFEYFERGYPMMERELRDRAEEKKAQAVAYLSKITN